jgi:hypothetical protein
MSSERSPEDEAPAGERTTATESPVLLHVWDVEPGRQEAAVEQLEAMLSDVSRDPEFVSARVLENAEGNSIAFILEMRTVEDRRRLEGLPVVRQTLDHLEGTVNLVIRLYHQVDVQGA